MRRRAARSSSLVFHHPFSNTNDTNDFQTAEQTTRRYPEAERGLGQRAAFQTFEAFSILR